MSAFVIRFVQGYAVGDGEAFLRLEALAAIDRIGADGEHVALFAERAPLITRTRTELYETLDL